MENASKALLMAGGVLIGVLIISLAVFLFADFGSTSAEINAQNAQKQITTFNSKFTAYQGYIDDKEGWKITIYDIISLAAYAKENNDYYEVSDDDENYISVIIVDGINRNIEKQNDDYTKLINEYTNQGKLTKFSCEAINYNSSGRVRSIIFRKIQE